jgi:hypothetical protein
MSTGRNTQVTTWRRFTAAEKKAYRARVRRRKNWRVQIELDGQWHDIPGITVTHVNGERL